MKLPHIARVRRKGHLFLSIPMRKLLPPADILNQGNLLAALSTTSVKNSKHPGTGEFAIIKASDKHTMFINALFNYQHLSLRSISTFDDIRMSECEPTISLMLLYCTSHFGAFQQTLVTLQLTLTSRLTSSPSKELRSNIRLSTG